MIAVWVIIKKRQLIQTLYLDKYRVSISYCCFYNLPFLCRTLFYTN